jgi:hypothetical protein
MHVIASCGVLDKPCRIHLALRQSGRSLEPELRAAQIEHFGEHRRSLGGSHALGSIKVSHLG